MKALTIIKKSARGSALLTALLVMTLAASAAMAMIVRQNFDIRRTEQMLTTDRVYQHALGVETWAVLELLAARANLEEGAEAVDTLYDDWAQPLPTTDVEEGYLRGEIIDLQGLFNLNNLVAIETWNQEGFEEGLTNEPVEEEQAADEEAEAGEPLFIDDDALEELDRFSQLAIFTRLLMLLAPDLYEEDAFEIAVAVRNWLNPESGIDYIYENAFPSYRAGHRPMASVTELRMVAGMTPELFEALVDYVTVLPPSLLAELGFEQALQEEEGGQTSSTVVTPINVNTAPPVVLQALLGGLSEEEAQDISLSPGEEGFRTREEFLEAINVEDENKRLIELGLADKIGVSSNHFLVRSEAGLGRQSLVLFSLLQRVDDGYVRVVWRSRGTL